MDWRVVDERLIRRGELLLSLDFLERYDLDLSFLNCGKVGRPYRVTYMYVVFLAGGTDKFYLSLLGSVSGHDARHRCLTGLFLQSISIPQVLSPREALFRLSLHSRDSVQIRL